MWYCDAGQPAQALAQRAMAMLTHLLVLRYKTQPVGADYGFQGVNLVRVPLPRGKRSVETRGEGQDGHTTAEVDDGQLSMVGRRPRKVDDGIRGSCRGKGVQRGLAEVPDSSLRVAAKKPQFHRPPVRRDGCDGACSGPGNASVGQSESRLASLDSFPGIPTDSSPFFASHRYDTAAACLLAHAGKAGQRRPRPHRQTRRPPPYLLPSPMDLASCPS